MLDFDSVRKFCSGREVDLVIAPSSTKFGLCLHGEFDGYGDFFSLLFGDVEYVELAGGFTVGELVMVDDVASLALLTPKWARLVGLYAGPTVAFRTADTQGWDGLDQMFVVVANQIRCEPGRDWPAGRSLC
ncbi:MAG: hypothetical protein NT062_33875 [Proteobacteria bacterium]|nr:hypothetical protein [Pseudomonadota bacterium]